MLGDTRAVSWREHRLLEALQQLANVADDEYERLVPSADRAGIDAVHSVARRATSFFAMPSSARDPAALGNAAFEKKLPDGSDALAARTVERAFDSLHTALGALRVPVRIDRARGHAIVVDAPDAWRGDRLSTFRARLQPEGLPRVFRQSVDDQLRVVLNAARGTRPGIAAVVAPAGYGKTTALGQIADRAPACGIAWTAAALCEDFDAGVPAQVRPSVRIPE